MDLLEVNGVGKSFGGVRALDNLHLLVGERETVGLMGANGAGKTTLFGIIAGHVRPTEGMIHFRRQRITGLRPDRICRLGIARTFQIVRPFAGMTARENVEIALLFGSSARPSTGSLQGRAVAVLDEVGLADLADLPAGKLTLSARKRLEVARALATSPELLLLDEVMAGLTPREVEEMVGIVRNVKADRSLSIVIVEHVQKALTALSDRIVVLHHGEIIAEGSADEVAANQAVRRAYLGERDA